MNHPRHALISSISAALALAVTLGLSGCGNNGYHFGPPPADSVTFPTASTQGWLVQFGAPAGTNSYRASDTAQGVATDFQGNVIVLDQTYGAFTGFTNSGGSQFAVVKFDSAGNRVWTQQLGTGSGDNPYAIATDTQGNIIVGGSTRGAFTGFTNAAGARQSVVIKLNPAGQVVWTQQFPATNGPGTVTSLATDSQSNVIVGGHYVDTSNNLYGYVMKLSGADGSVVWNQSGGSLLDVSSVAADPQNNIVAVGDFGTSGSGSSSSIYMAAKLNGTNGQTLWQELPVTFAKFGLQNLIYTSAALDAQGDIFIGGLNQSSGYAQCAVAELANATGAQQWQQQFGAVQGCVPGSIATDTAGNVLIGGGAQAPFFTASNPPNTDDVFLAKFSPSGSAVWLQQFGTGYEGARNSTPLNALIFVATDSSNNAYVAGTTFGAFPGNTNSAGASQVFVTQFGQ
jgi:hypothetical protein